VSDVRLVADESEALERRVGHPGLLWDGLKARVQEESVTQFRAVETDWLELMWSIDAFRVAGVPPRAMGRPDVDSSARLAAVYRTKGNWFATLVSLLLQNRTSQPISPRTKVRGFSQVHQIDVAWPVRNVDPRVCIETKVTGAPAFGHTPARSAIADFSNRRKELKFAATDLKLYRRQQNTAIEHWGVWRDAAPPQTYFLWAARLKAGPGRGADDIRRLCQEAQALSNSYLDGAGLVAWREKRDASGYEKVEVPVGFQVSDLDDVLYRIETEIGQLLGPSGLPPAPFRAEHPVVDVEQLASDSRD
jgi:hypothetical protein